MRVHGGVPYPGVELDAGARDIAGTFVLFNGEAKEVDRSDDDCRETGGYDDVRMDVVVRDESGAIIATDRTEALPPKEDGNAGERQRERWTCRYAFTVTVPDAPFYTVEVGNRGEQTYSRADLEAAGWSVELTLGQ